MAQMHNQIEVSAFCTEGVRNKRPRAVQVRGGSMLVKLGVCCAAAALVLLIKVSAENRADPFAALEGTIASNENELDDQLGKLRFVELPGIIEVFSSESKSLLGIESDSSELINEGTLLKLVAGKDQAVTIGSVCQTIETGEDPLYGKFVLLDMGADTELTVYGLSELTPEAGQPLLSGDELGRISGKMVLYAAVRIAGRPSDPATYLRMDIAR